MVVAFIATAVLAIVLIVAAGIDALRGTPRSRWLSFAGGMAIGYVFLRLLPELTHAQQKVREHHTLSTWLEEHLLFLVALVGAALVFGIERAAKGTRQMRPGAGGRAAEERAANWVFWLHMGVMAVYTALIGYLLFDEGKQTVTAVAVLGIVMATHFSGIAVGLERDYRSLYAMRGRWILAASTVAGALVGYATELPDFAFHLLLGVLAGVVIFNVIKEEIPPDQQSRFWAVALGIVATTTLLWAVAGM
jgi:zinc transporter ZupT